MTHQSPSPATEVLDFLNSIEGAGYGGMASFEIARQHARDMASLQPATPTGDYEHGYADGVEWATVHAQSSADSTHYLSAIRRRLEQLHDVSKDARAREQISDEVDWIDAQIEQFRSPAQSKLELPLADLHAVVEIAGRNEYAPQISRIKAWLSSLSSANCGGGK